MPGDLSGLESLTRSRGTLLVDDAAQCLGATVDGRRCGTFGDVGFFSLGRGKGITSMGGGILVTDSDDVARNLEAAVRSLPRAGADEAVKAFVGALAYAAMLGPSRYWIVDRIPFLELGGSHFDTDFSIGRLSGYQARLTGELMPLTDAYNASRRACADALRAAIEGIEGIEVPRSPATAKPAYLRLPVLARDTAHRDDLLARLRAVGIRASASYPTTVGDIPGIARYLAPDQAPCPGATSVAARILTLPTHPGVTQEDRDRMIAVIRGGS